MKICRFLKDDIERWGVVEDGAVFEVETGPFGQGPSGGLKRTGEGYRLEDVRLLPPSSPSKIVAIGLNYRAHAAEFHKPLPEEPMLILKPSTAVIGHNDAIVYPSHMSGRVDYEGELALVIGKRARDVPVESAGDYILGYTCFNDVTARDLQAKDIQYTRAKGFDTFACVGPWIETGIDPTNVRIETCLNGEKRQDASTRDMVFDVFTIVSFVSRVMTLLPGDIITTGTPSGIGGMKPGDTVEVAIDGIGTLRNTVVER